MFWRFIEQMFTAFAVVFLFDWAFVCFVPVWPFTILHFIRFYASSNDKGAMVVYECVTTLCSLHYQFLQNNNMEWEHSAYIIWLRVSLTKMDKLNGDWWVEFKVVFSDWRCSWRLGRCYLIITPFYPLGSQCMHFLPSVFSVSTLCSGVRLLCDSFGSSFLCCSLTSSLFVKDT